MTDSTCDKQRSDSKRRFIKPRDYCLLAVSRRPLTHCDDRANGLRGLSEVESGITFFVDAVELANYHVYSDVALPRKPR